MKRLLGWALLGALVGVGAAGDLRGQSPADPGKRAADEARRRAEQEAARRRAEAARKRAEAAARARAAARKKAEEAARAKARAAARKKTEEAARRRAEAAARARAEAAARKKAEDAARALAAARKRAEASAKARAESGAHSEAARKKAIAEFERARRGPKVDLGRLSPEARRKWLAKRKEENRTLVRRLARAKKRPAGFGLTGGDTETVGDVEITHNPDGSLDWKDKEFPALASGHEPPPAATSSDPSPTVSDASPGASVSGPTDSGLGTAPGTSFDFGSSSSAPPPDGGAAAAKAAAERKARQDAERKARQEAARKAREKAQREARERARKEAERRAREAAERKAREEAQRKAREEAQRKAREDAQRRAREKAQREARERARRKAREEAERKAREEAERRAREGADGPPDRTGGSPPGGGVPSGGGGRPGRTGGSPSGAGGSAGAGGKSPAGGEAGKGKDKWDPLREKAKEKLKDKAKDVLKDALEKLVPGGGLAVSATDFLNDVVIGTERELGKKTLEKNPGAKLLIEEHSLSGTFTTALDYAGKGYTAWQDKNGIWYFTKDPAYRPKTGFVQLFQPDPGRGDGAIKQVKGAETVDEAGASRAREKAGRKVLVEKTVDKLTDLAKDRAKGHSEKVIPGSKYAFEAHEALTKAVREHTREMARSGLRGNPGAKLVSEESGLSNPTSSAQAQAARGKTVWRDANGIWYTTDRPGYRPKTPYVEMYRPVRKGPGGAWEWRREGPGR